MTIGAASPNIGKDQFDMTLPAFDRCMHSLQQEERASMVELGKCADRPKTRECMTFPACYSDTAMRAAYL